MPLKRWGLKCIYVCECVCALHRDLRVLRARVCVCVCVTLALLYGVKWCAVRLPCLALIRACTKNSCTFVHIYVMDIFVHLVPAYTRLHVCTAAHHHHHHHQQRLNAYRTTAKDVRPPSTTLHTHTHTELRSKYHACARPRCIYIAYIRVPHFLFIPRSRTSRNSYFVSFRHQNGQSCWRARVSNRMVINRCAIY